MLHREACPHFDLALGRDIAAGIPDAWLVVLPGDAFPIFLPDPQPALDAINDFLRDDPDDKGGEILGAFRTILFTDLESSTALTQSLGDAKAQELLHGHNDAVRAALAAHGGRR